MQLLKVSQQTDREAWLDLRRGLITGSKAKGIKPLTRGADRTPAGFWELLAERLAVAKDGEPDMDRGLRLENEAIKLTAKEFKLNLDTDPAMWVSDIDPNIAVSPDSAEAGDAPTYACEAKCFASKNHLQVVLMDIRARKAGDYRAFDNIPKDNQDQVLQYFVVNENLKTVYFTLYDDRIALDPLMHHVIVVQRDDVQAEVDALQQVELDVIKQVTDVIKELKEYAK